MLKKVREINKKDDERLKELGLTKKEVNYDRGRV